MTVLDTSLNQYVQHTFNFLHLLRVYKSEKVFTLSTRLSTGILIIICLFANLVLVLSELIGLKDAADLRHLARGIGAVSFHITGITKGCYCISQADRFTNLINMLHHCHYLSSKICQNAQDREKLHKELEVARKLTSIFAFYWPPIGIGAAMHYCFNPISFRFYEIYIQKHDSDTVPKLLPLEGWFPWDINQYYGLSYFLQISGVIGCFMGTLCFDQFYVPTLLVICSYLKFLSKALESESGSTKVIEKTVLEERLRNCVKQHVEIMKYIDELENVGSPCMFVQCVQNILILCLCSFEGATLQITPDIDCVVKITNLVEFSTGATIQLFFFCYVATDISLLGLNVADAAYSCQWVSSGDGLQSGQKYNQIKHKVKYSVLMISIRAQRRIILTGGPFYILSLETFKSIIGIAISNALILSQVYEN